MSTQIQRYRHYIQQFEALMATEQVDLAFYKNNIQHILLHNITLHYITMRS